MDDIQDHQMLSIKIPLVLSLSESVSFHHYSNSFVTTPMTDLILGSRSALASSTKPVVTNRRPIAPHLAAPSNTHKPSESPAIGVGESKREVRKIKGKIKRVQETVEQ